MIIVTGAKGFIGRNLVKRLIESGEDVFEIDIDNKLCYTPITHAKHVYHMGAISDTTETNIAKIYENNIQYSIDLFEWCAKYNIPVSYASSASVYGNMGQDINPLNYYALSKATVDLWVQDNIHRLGIIRGYRFFNVYGEGEDRKNNQASPVTQFTKQAKEAGNINIFAPPGNGVRDFIWVGDVCRVMLNDERESGIYDLGTGNPVSFSAVAHMIATKYNATVTQIPFPDHLRNKYQYFTCAQQYDSECITLGSYINGI